MTGTVVPCKDGDNAHGRAATPQDAAKERAMTPKDRVDRYMRAQLEHDAWRRHIPQPPPEPRRLADTVTALAVLTLTAGMLYLLLDGLNWTDLRDGLALLWEAL